MSWACSGRCTKSSPFRFAPFHHSFSSDSETRSSNPPFSPLPLSPNAHRLSALSVYMASGLCFSSSLLWKISQMLSKFWEFLEFGSVQKCAGALGDPLFSLPRGLGGIYQTQIGHVEPRLRFRQWNDTFEFRKDHIWASTFNWGSYCGFFFEIRAGMAT